MPTKQPDIPPLAYIGVGIAVIVVSLIVTLTTKSKSMFVFLFLAGPGLIIWGIWRYYYETKIISSLKSNVDKMKNEVEEHRKLTQQTGGQTNPQNTFQSMRQNNPFKADPNHYVARGQRPPINSQQAQPYQQPYQQQPYQQQPYQQPYNGQQPLNTPQHQPNQPYPQGQQQNPAQPIQQGNAQDPFAHLKGNKKPDPFAHLKTGNQAQDPFAHLKQNQSQKNPFNEQYTPNPVRSPQEVRRDTAYNQLNQAFVPHHAQPSHAQPRHSQQPIPRAGCPSCGAPGSGLFCSQCGSRL